MSVAAIAWAWQVPDVTSTQRLTLIALADYADADWSCFPGQDRLARQACVSRRQMVRVLAQLEERGLIRREARFRGDGKRSSDRFILVPSDKVSCDTGDRHQVTPVSQQEPPVEPSEEREAASPSIDYFELAWKAWPRSDDRKSAERAFISAAKKRRMPGQTHRGSQEALAEVVIRYATAYTVTTEKGFVPYLASWLNKERWNDPLPTVKGTMVPSHLVALNPAPSAPAAPEIPMTARQPMCPEHPFYPMPCQRCHDEEVERRAGLG